MLSRFSLLETVICMLLNYIENNYKAESYLCII